MEYNITQKFLSMNRSWKQLTVIGTVVHETATPNASDENEFNYFNTGYRGASAHAFVDYDSITQTIPWNEQSWHAGYTANTNYIGIELCHYDDVERFAEVWKRAVWLFAYIHVNIINKPTIDKNSLMSHAEVSLKWKETNHTDPVGYFNKFGKSVDDFRSEVQQAINEMLKPKKYYVVTNYIPQTEWGIELTALFNKYFYGLNIERWYAKSNATGMWIETQYMTKENAQILADRLNKDALLWKLVEE